MGTSNNSYLNTLLKITMIRVKRGNVARRRRRKLLRLAKGFKGAHSRLFRVANQQVMKSLVYAYVGRKRCKREHRMLWIRRVNAGSRRVSGELASYAELKGLLRCCSIWLNLKMLAQLVVLDPLTFDALAVGAEEMFVVDL